MKERSANCDQYQEWGGETIIVFTIPDTQENILRNSKMAPLGTDLENHILDDLVFSPKNQIFEKNGKVSRSKFFRLDLVFVPVIINF